MLAVAHNFVTVLNDPERAIRLVNVRHDFIVWIVPFEAHTRQIAAARCVSHRV
jgi:hypothetical protein